MKALIYTRLRINHFFHALGKEWLGEENCHFMSDYNGLEPLSIMPRFYSCLKEPASAFANIPLVDPDYRSIQTRCRYLRRLAPSQARQFINAMWLVFERMFDEVQPDIITGMVMDSYVLDVCDRVARTRGKDYSGFLENMINGYSRLTSRGELRCYREPTDDEVDQAWEMLRRKTYVPKMQQDFMGPLGPAVMFFTKYLKERVKEAYFHGSKVYYRDPYNFYYNTAASSKFAMSCGGLQYLTYPRYADHQWREAVEHTRLIGGKVIYFPLQFYPEASIDYWGTSLELAEFEKVTFQVLSHADPSHLIIVKEHPSAIALRNPRFYEKIRGYENVVLLPFTLPSNEAIEQADVVLTWTGSVGFEAAVRGLPLITMGKAYYDTNGSFCDLNSLDELEDLPGLCDRAEQHCTGLKDVENQKQLIRGMMRGLLPGYVYTVDYTGNRQINEHKELQRLAQSMTDIFARLGTSAQPLRPGSL